MLRREFGDFTARIKKRGVTRPQRFAQRCGREVKVRVKVWGAATGPVWPARARQRTKGGSEAANFGKGLWAVQRVGRWDWPDLSKRVGRLGWVADVIDLSGLSQRR